MNAFILCATDEGLETVLAGYVQSHGIRVVGNHDGSSVTLAELNAEILANLGVREWYREHADMEKLDSSWEKRARSSLGRLHESEPVAWIDSTVLATADFWLDLDSGVSIVFVYDDAAAFLSRAVVAGDDLVPGVLREYLKRRAAILDIADLAKDRYPDRVHLIDGRESGSSVAFIRGRLDPIVANHADALVVPNEDSVKRALFDSILGSPTMRVPRGSSLRWINDSKLHARPHDVLLQALRDYFELTSAIMRFASRCAPDSIAGEVSGGGASPQSNALAIAREIDGAFANSASHLPYPQVADVGEAEAVSNDTNANIVDELKGQLAQFVIEMRSMRQEASSGALVTGQSLTELRMIVNELATASAASLAEQGVVGLERARDSDLSESFARARELMDTLNGLGQRILTSLSESESLLNSEYERGVMSRQLASLERELSATRQGLEQAVRRPQTEASDLLQEFWKNHQPEDFWVDLRRNFHGRNWYSSEPDGVWMGPGLVGEIVLPLVRSGSYRFELEIVDAMADSCTETIRMGIGREFAMPELQQVLPHSRFPLVAAFTAEIFSEACFGKVVLLVSTSDAFRPSDSGLEDSRLLSIKCRTLRVQFCGGL
jgi:hypothetical protein